VAIHVTTVCNVLRASSGVIKYFQAAKMGTIVVVITMTHVVKTAYIAVSRMIILWGMAIVVMTSEFCVVPMRAVTIQMVLRCVVMEMEIAASAIIVLE
jgi:hypothetical protein